MQRSMSSAGRWSSLAAAEGGWASCVLACLGVVWTTGHMLPIDGDEHMVQRSATNKQEPLR